MEELLDDNKEGQQRPRKAVCTEHCSTGQVENKDKKTVLTTTGVPADTEECNAAMATDEVEHFEHA